MTLCRGTSVLGHVTKKYMVSVNASLEGRTALIPPIMGFDVVQSIELPCYYLLLPSWANFIQNNQC